MLICNGCAQSFPDSEPRWRCDACGNSLRYESDAMFSPADLRGRPATLWRYHEALGLNDAANCVTLGEGFTPILASRKRANLWIKDEGANPTGSFKARGLCMAVTMARHYGLKKLAIPSAGNAAGALAAYAAAVDEARLAPVWVLLAVAVAGMGVTIPASIAYAKSGARRRPWWSGKFVGDREMK